MSKIAWFPPGSSSASTITADQGAPNTVGNAWPIKITDGTDTALVSAAGELSVSAATLPLPTGAATEATLSAMSAKLPAALGQTTMAASMSVAIASDQSAVAISAASLPLPSGASTSSNQTSGGQKTQISKSDGTAVSVTQLNTNPTATDYGLVTNSMLHGYSSGGGGSFVDVKVNPSGSLEVNANQGGSWTVAATQSGTWNINNVSGTVSLPTGAATAAKQPALGTAGTASTDVITVQGIASMTALKVDGSAVTQPVSIAATVATKETVSATATLSNVSSSASNVTLLASNSNRLGATFYNDSTQICYLKFGATASSTSFTIAMAAGSYYELPTPHLYTGIIDGIWASANGSMRVTELS